MAHEWPPSRYNTDSMKFKNTEKYLLPPTWEQIEEFINELGVSYNRFERFFLIPYNNLTQIKRGQRQLSKEYWHIIYEKIRPAYGAGFLEDHLERPKNNIPTQVVKPIENIKPKKPTLKTDSHNRLTTLK